MPKKPSFIVPYFVETNGKVEKFLAVARKPEVQCSYKELLRELKARPEEVGQKLREVTWAKKNVDDIVRELESERGK